MEPKKVIINGKPLKVISFLKQFERPSSNQPQFGSDRSSAMKRMLENGADSSDGEPSEKKDRTLSEASDVQESEENSEMPGGDNATSPQDSTFEINLLFLQSMNPLLEKIEIQDILMSCDMNPGRAGRILKQMSEERKGQVFFAVIISINKY